MTALCVGANKPMESLKGLRMEFGNTGPNAFQKLLELHKNTGKARHIVGVFDCISARIAERAGFEGAWVSSLGLSIVAGKCDRNEIPWTDITNTVGLISESCDLPIIVDGDEGFGDTNIARLYARRAGARGASCIAFEDKTYPKKNSFSEGVELCSIEEFARKLRSCKEALGSTSMSIIARTDSLVADEPMQKALDRAHGYRDAGADAVIIHSKAKTVDQLAEFMSRWDGACPVVAIPTSYDQTDPQVYDDIGVAIVIWANQLLRASIKAMERTAETLFANRSVGGLTDDIVSIKTALAYANCGLCEGAQ